MNTILTKITKLEKSEGITLVHTSTKGDNFFSFIIDSNSDISPKIGSEIYLIFKESEVTILKGNKAPISIENYFPCTVNEIKESKILSKVYLRYQENIITAIISTDSLKRLNLKIGEKVSALIKATEITLMEK